MSELPPLISDLALILIAAGIVTIIFKRLGQPLVLGYIVAGFLAGPHMPYTPTVADTGGIQTWADIGVIFLMFTLGLEFSFKKIIKMGAKPILAACMIMFCMISVGSVVGHLFGWSSMDSLFLGGMLAMSSTTIIYKAFDDLGLRQQKFSGEVLSVLILEDILGILLMVILSAMAVSRNFQGTELVLSLGKLLFFLILWFIVGIFIVPIFLRKSGRWMNNETLAVVSVGLCLALVVAASSAGYSSAFGAFMMGSILAETLEAESIERVVAPLKDLFGAVFFVSVGMLVDPAILAEYWLPILCLTLAVILGQAIFGTGSFMLSGQSLRVAMQCGFSMAQIGEFAFIIASLGISLGVTSNFLYPVVVAVSIVTTFLTPYMIRAAAPAYGFVQRFLPDTMVRRLDNRASTTSTPTTVRPWRKLINALITQVSIYTTLSIAAVILSIAVLLPLCRALMSHWVGNAVCGLLTIAIVSPFLRAIVMRKNHSEEWKSLHRRGQTHRAGLLLTFVVRYVLAMAVVLYVIDFLSPLPSPWRWPVHIVAAALFVWAMILCRRVKYISICMERTFLKNLRSREHRPEDGRVSAYYAGKLLSHNMHLAQIEIPIDSSLAGKTLQELEFGQKDGVLVTAIIRDGGTAGGTGKGGRINIPDGTTKLYPCDHIEVVGDDNSLQALTQRIAADVTPLTPNDSAHHLVLRRLIINEASPLCHRTLRDSGLKTDYHCLAVGFEGDDGTIDTAASSQTIEPSSVLWLVGEEADLARLTPHKE